MSERVRRIRKKKASSKGKRVFLVVMLVIIVVVAWFFIPRQGPEEVPEIAPVIKNQETAAVFCFVDECFLVNIEGIAFKKSSRPSGNLLFLIEDKVRESFIEIGDGILDSHTLKELLFLRKKISDNLSLRLGSAQTYDKNMADYEFETNEGWLLKLSTANNANATLEILKRVLNELGSTSANLEYIDLRLSTKVFIK